MVSNSWLRRPPVEYKGVNMDVEDGAYLTLGVGVAGFFALLKEIRWSLQCRTSIQTALYTSTLPLRGLKYPMRISGLWHIWRFAFLITLSKRATAFTILKRSISTSQLRKLQSASFFDHGHYSRFTFYEHSNFCPSCFT